MIRGAWRLSFFFYIYKLFDILPESNCSIIFIRLCRRKGREARVLWWGPFVYIEGTGKLVASVMVTQY
jgi:hypothetical protein